MEKSLLLMVGTEKTGTTSIQHFLAKNSQKLRYHGIEYPLQCAASLHHVPVVHELLGNGPNYDNLQTIERLNASVVILNSEHFDLRFGDALLDGARTLLLPIFDRIKILLVFRDQLSYAQSRYCEAIKWGETACFNDFFEKEYELGRFDYFSRINGWLSLGQQVEICAVDFNSSANIIIDSLDHADLGLDRKLLLSLSHPRARLNATPSIDDLLLFRAYSQQLAPELRHQYFVRFRTFANQLKIDERRAKWKFPPDLSHYIAKLNKANKPMLTLEGKRGEFSWLNDLSSLFSKYSAYPERDFQEIVGGFISALLAKSSQSTFTTSGNQQADTRQSRDKVS